MKKFFLAVCLLASSLCVFDVCAIENVYRDVSVDKWYYEDVMLATQQEILNGIEDNLFLPDANLKVSEAIVVVSRIHAKLKNQVIEYEYEYECNEVWYEPYLEYAIANCIIEKDLQDLECDITRLNFARICYRIMSYENDRETNDVMLIPDLTQEIDGYNEVKTLYALGIMAGVDEYGCFMPEEFLTRAQLATVINRILYPERRVRKEFTALEKNRYESFKNKVLYEKCNSNEIFVTCAYDVTFDEKMDKLQKEIDKFGGECAFYLVTLDGEFSIGYNIDKQFLSASTVKAPFSLYSFKEIESGNGTLDEVIIYRQEHYHAGSGVIQYSPFGTEYSLYNVLYNTIHVSDNTGYYMLQNRFGISGYNDFLEKIGCSRMKLIGGMRWGYVYPREVAIIWNEIYNYSKTSEYGKKLFELFINAKYNFIKQAYLTKYSKLDYEIAHKSGFYSDGRHDEAIVLLDSVPYFVTITTKPKGDGRDKTYFNNTAIILEEIMREYMTQVKK